MNTYTGSRENDYPEKAQDARVEEALRHARLSPFPDGGSLALHRYNINPRIIVQSRMIESIVQSRMIKNIIQDRIDRECFEETVVLFLTEFAHVSVGCDHKRPGTRGAGRAG
eukprot:1107075-Pyramimonas_sp.AAC.1